MQTTRVSVMFRPSRTTALFLGLSLLVMMLAPPISASEQAVEGISGPVLIERGEYNVPRITAATAEDAVFALGMLHAEDRLFQIDVLRHTFNGTLAEILGEGALASDVELRTLGLNRAAAATLEVLGPEAISWLEAYAAGVNAYVAGPDFVLPPEYGVLELTVDSIADWAVVDSLTVAKGLAFALSFDLLDLELTEALLAYSEAGVAFGFDGGLLFEEDLFRKAPFDPTLAIPEALAKGEKREPSADKSPKSKALPEYLGERTRNMIRSYRDRLREIPVFQGALRSLDEYRGSNWWVAAGSVTRSGFPVLANDPHLSLGMAPIFYEVHLRADLDSETPLNVIGVSFPGTPGVVQGCNTFGCWGSTVHPMDAVDIYQEDVLIGDPGGINTIFEGKPEPVVAIFQTYLLNVIGDGVDNNTVDAGVSELEGGITFIVPRRNNGPVVEVDISDPFDIKAFSLQYTGWGPTMEIEAIRRFAFATNPDEFKEALQFFDFGSQNWSWADKAGNIAYFTSAELPLREDLQTLGGPDGGVPPFIVRDGTHTLKHEWLPLTNPQPDQSVPFEILPFDEMPQIVNPESGYIISANNDPVGNTLDNDVLNELRPGGGIFYLNPGYATGFRAGRIQQLFDTALADEGKVDVRQLMRIQANHQLLDAEVLIPYISTAFANAQRGDAPPELAELAADPRLVEAMSRFEGWDFSTPTGIQAGYDPSDDAENLREPSQREIDASVAATLYSVWRGQILLAVIDGTLEQFGLVDWRPNSALSMSALRNMLDVFDSQSGVGLSGVDFFVVDGVTDPEDERDVLLLRALRDGLDLLAGEAFAAAFDLSTDQDDYRWGKLHRIVFEHPLGGGFNVPPAGGLDNLEDDLLGLSRSGGYGAVDASSHDARADSVDDFMFSSGPARRFIGLINPAGIIAREVLPGGESGVLGSPHLADQLRLWLTNSYHALDVEAEAGDSAGSRRLVPRVSPEAAPID